MLQFGRPNGCKIPLSYCHHGQASTGRTARKTRLDTAKTTQPATGVTGRAILIKH